MIPIPVLGIPHYNRPDLLLRCIASIDYPVETLVIVQNGPDDQMPDITLARLNPELRTRRIVHIKHPNAGVAGAWNEVIKLFPAAWWMLVNNDIQFAPGDLANMAVAADAAKYNYAALFGNHGHSFFVITSRGVFHVGLFDENIYPAYLEDCDWMRRLHMAKEQYMDVGGIKAIHGDEKLTGSCTIQSDAKARENNHRTHGNNFTYYTKKWGGINGEEKFQRPFNDPNWPLWAWRYVPEFRQTQQWK